MTIPNAQLNSAILINESSPSARYRVRIEVGVAYGSDIDRVEAALREAATRVPVVLDRPEPRVRFRAFGDSALEMELLCWIRDPADRGSVTHLLNTAVYGSFMERGITIPFPQRDVHVTPTAPVGGDPGITEPADD